MSDPSSEARTEFVKAFKEFLDSLRASGLVKDDPQVWLADLKDGRGFFQLTTYLYFNEQET